MLSHLLTRKRLTIAAFAMIAVAVVVSPAGATSRPATECPSVQIEVAAPRLDYIVALAPEHQARALLRVEKAREAVEIRFAGALRVQEAIRVDVQLADAEFADVEFLDLTRGDLSDLGNLVWLDRDVDAPHVRWQQEWLYHDIEAQPRASHAVTAGIDMLVSVARFPARASLVAQHLIEAFAKVTPRVLHALL